MTEKSDHEAPVIIVMPPTKGEFRYEGTWEADDAGRLVIRGTDGRMIAMYAPSAWLFVRDASPDLDRERRALALAKGALTQISNRSNRDQVFKNMADGALHDIADIEAQP